MKNPLPQVLLYCLALGLYLLAIITPTFARDTHKDVQILLGLSLEELLEVEIATGRTQSVAKAPAVTTVITADDIARIGARNIDEVLETVPGLQVEYSSFAQRSLYVMRGVESVSSPEMLMMINGVPITRLEGGDRGLIWQGMTVRAIQRIEVIRGPGSAVYGADAFSGVINIITKTAADIEKNRVGVSLSSFDTQEVWTVAGYQQQDFAVAASAAYQSSGGHKGIIGADGQTELDGLINIPAGLPPASLAPDTVHAAYRRLDAHLDLSKGHWRWLSTYQGQFGTEMVVGFDSALDPDADMQDKRLNTQLSYQNAEFSENWEVRASATYTDARSRTNLLQVYPPGTALPGPSGGLIFYPEGILVRANYAERHAFFDTSAFYKGFNQHTVRIGAGYAHQDLHKVEYGTNRGFDAQDRFITPAEGIVDLTDTPAAVYPEEVRKSWYLFAQDAWQFAKAWELTAGIRYDRYSDFGSTTNPRLALVWQVTPQLTSKLLYGRAFRAPSFRELYVRNNENSLGNPDLKPEVMDNWEWVFDWQPSPQQRFALNLYRFDIEDKIIVDFIVNPNAPGVTLNRDSWRGEGFELEGKWQLTPDWLFRFNYSYAKAEQNDYPTAYYPVKQLYLQASWQFAPDWLWSWQARRLIDIRREAGDFRPQPANETFFDTNLWHQGNAWDVKLGVRNLLDAKDYTPSNPSIPGDMPLSGRTVFVQIEYQF